MGKTERERPVKDIRKIRSGMSVAEKSGVGHHGNGSRPLFEWACSVDITQSQRFLVVLHIEGGRAWCFEGALEGMSAILGKRTGAHARRSAAATGLPEITTKWWSMTNPWMGQRRMRGTSMSCTRSKSLSLIMILSAHIAHPVPIYIQSLWGDAVSAPRSGTSSSSPAK